MQTAIQSVARSLAVLAAFSLTAVADAPEEAEKPNPDSITLVRIKYDSTGGYGESWYRHEGRNWQRWETDFPQAEENLIFRLKQLTSLQINPKPIVLRLTDEVLFDHPFIFMSDVGWQQLSDDEKAALKKYLSNGGFLWADDFWGDAEWKNFADNTKDLHPDWNWRAIPKEHPILSIVYEMPACPQIPARIFFRQSGLEYDPPGVHRYPTGGRRGMTKVNFMGLFDSDEKLLAVATHNTDIADGWEREGESREFFDRFSVKSYAITINILVYAMTH